MRVGTLCSDLLHWILIAMKIKISFCYVESEIRFSIGIGNKCQAYLKNSLDLSKMGKCREFSKSSLFSYLNLFAFSEAKLGVVHIIRGACALGGIQLN